MRVSNSNHDEHDEHANEIADDVSDDVSSDSVTSNDAENAAERRGRLFHPAVRQWFSSAFASPTLAQQLSWPAIARGESPCCGSHGKREKPSPHFSGA